MKTVSKRLSLKRGIAPIIIVIVLAVIGLGAFVLYSNSRNSQSSSSPSNKTEIDNSTIPGLNKIAESNYIFYYPKAYIKLDKKRGSGTVLYYALEAKKESQEGISLAVESASERNETPSTEFCNFSLKFFLRLNKNARIVEAKPIDFVKSHGCDFLWVDDSVPGKLSYHEKQLWYKEGTDINVYWATASSLLNSPQNERDALDLAINNSILK